MAGIVENGKYESLNDENQPVIFRPLLQQYESTTALVARSRMPGIGSSQRFAGPFETWIRVYRYMTWRP
ncbi:MAG TPA: hypothetical protein VHU83_17185 [Bryobacteraceae bacterium]|nr:hypothetical protein [Bryobacteraceae bacterium]